MSIDQFGMWCGRMIHYRTGKTFVTATAQLRDRATGHRHTVAGFTPRAEIERVAALPVTIRMRASSSRLQQNFPLLCILPARHRPSELRWDIPPCALVKATDAPAAKNRGCSPRPDTSERY